MTSAPKRATSYLLVMLVAALAYLWRLGALDWGPGSFRLRRTR